MTVAFLPLLALGWTRAKPVPSPVRLADPTGDVITRELIDAGLWRWDVGLSLQRSGRRLTARLFMPEQQQSDRCLGRDEATALRAVLVGILQAEGYAVRFSDALFCERGKKGWAVVVSAVGG